MVYYILQFVSYSMNNFDSIQKRDVKNEQLQN